MASAWLTNDILSDEVVDAALELYELGLEDHGRLVFRQGLAWAKEEAQRAGDRKDPGVDGQLYWTTRSRARGLCEFCGEGLARGERLQVEHMVSRLSGRALRIPWSILHA